MYEQYRDEVMGPLCNLDAETLRTVMAAMDQAATYYEVKRAECQMIVYGSEMPEMVKNYIVARAIEGVKPRTLKGYQQLLGNFFRSISKPVDRLTANDMRVWLFQYENRRHVSKQTMDHYRVILNSFFSYHE